MTSVYRAHNIIKSARRSMAFLLFAQAVAGVALLQVQAFASDSSNDDYEERIAVSAKDGRDWMVYGRTHSEQRFSTLTQINNGNVNKLGLAWKMDLPTLDGPVSTPIVVDGVAYISMSYARIVAVDIRNGKALWTFDPELTLNVSVTNSWTSRPNRGVAVWKDRVYVGTGDCRLVAVDKNSGEKAWDITTCDITKNYGITGAPRVADGKVLIGNGVADAGAPRGYVTAYDAETGEQIWRFYTVPGNPAEGFENEAMEMAAKTWTGEGWWNYAGGNAWDTIVYDPEFNQVYIGTDSSAQFNPKLRSPDGGDNLFLNSIIAVDASTGEYKWHYQVTPADAWNYSATNPMTLADLRIDGKVRKVLMQSPKNGFFYVLDRTTGKLISAEKIVPVTWASHIDLTTGRPAVMPEAKYYERSDLRAWVLPGPMGAHNWHPMAYHPEHQLMYVPTHAFADTYDASDTRALGAVSTDLHDVALDDKQGLQGLGNLVAWDPITQTSRWSVPQVTGFNGGLLATAGNLVFQGGGNGEFSAYAAHSGARLWSVRTGAAIQSAPVTVEVDGTQLVLISVGLGSGDSRFILPAYGSTEDARGAPALYAFKLNGDVNIPLQKGLDWPVPRPPVQTASAALIQQGEKEYKAFHCYACHAVEAKLGPGSSVPDLRYMIDYTHQQFDEIVRGGSRATRGMPAFGKEMGITVEQVDAIHAYLIEQQRKLYEGSSH